MIKKILSLLLAVSLMAVLFLGAVPSLAAGTITLKIHYHRPDGDYQNWDLWAFDPTGSYQISGLSSADGSLTTSPGYQFVPGTDEAICTLTLPTGISDIRFTIRYGDWEARDVEWEQTISLCGILRGTVDYYVESGIPSHGAEDAGMTVGQQCSTAITYNGRSQYLMVLGDDVEMGIVVTAAEYLSQGPNGEPAVKITLSSLPDQSITPDSFLLFSPEGSVPFTGIHKSNNVLYLYLAQPLYPDLLYSITFQGIDTLVNLPENPDQGHYTIYALVNEDWNDLRVWCWNDQFNVPEGQSWPGNITLSYDANRILCAKVPAGYRNLLLVANGGAVFTADVTDITSGRDVLIDCTEDPQNPAVYYVSSNAADCTHVLHNVQGLCLFCQSPVEHEYDDSGNCQCGAAAPPDTITVFAKIPDDWASVRLWGFDDEGQPADDFPWPGSLYMTSVGNGWYQASVPGWVRLVILISDSDEVFTEDIAIQLQPSVYIDASFVDYPTVSYSPTDAGFDCLHLSHSVEGLCLVCGDLVEHDYSVDDTCSCGAKLPIEDEPQEEPPVEDPPVEDPPSNPGKNENDYPTVPPETQPQPAEPTEPPQDNQSPDSQDGKKAVQKAFDPTIIFALCGGIIVAVMLFLLFLPPKAPPKKPSQDDEDE